VDPFDSVQIDGAADGQLRRSRERFSKVIVPRRGNERHATRENEVPHAHVFQQGSRYNAIHAATCEGRAASAEVRSSHTGAGQRPD
jgi:hypothetical protein